LLAKVRIVQESDNRPRKRIEISDVEQQTIVFMSNNFGNAEGTAGNNRQSGEQEVSGHSVERLEVGRDDPTV